MCLFNALRSNGTKQDIQAFDTQHKLDCLIKYFFDEIFLEPHYCLQPNLPVNWT